MNKYKVLHFDHFFKPGHDLKGAWFFKTLDEAEKFMADCEESKRKWPKTFGNQEYVLEEIDTILKKGKTFVFNSRHGDLARYNGKLVRLEFPLKEIGVDTTAWRARFIDGRYYDVFEDELSI